ERALNFDWQVISRLTPLEEWVLIDRLASMDDPYDYTASNRHGGSFSNGGEWSKGELVEHVTPFDFQTDRRRRFLEGTQREQENLRKRVRLEVVKREQGEGRAA